jgi:hypothetical protein
LGTDLVGGAERVAFATFLEEGEVKLVGVTAEDGPGYLLA